MSDEFETITINELSEATSLLETDEFILENASHINKKILPETVKEYMSDGLQEELNATQMQAVNSGITAELVAQIGQVDATPIGAIILYGGANAPSGYIICDGRAVSRTDYDKLFEKIGTTFGNGDGTTTFNVPDLRDKFAQGANGNLGESIEAGLPNIKGQVLSASWPDSAGDGHESGAFYDDGTAGNGANGADARRIAKFDASRSSSIYSDDCDTVQPPAVAINYIIKY